MIRPIVGIEGKLHSARVKIAENRGKIGGKSGRLSPISCCRFSHGQTLPNYKSCSRQRGGVFTSASPAPTEVRQDESQTALDGSYKPHVHSCLLSRYDPANRYRPA